MSIPNKDNSKKRRISSKSANALSRQSARDVQTALNYFGFGAGTPDGLLGRRTRAAISEYQNYLGLPATGSLTSIQQADLVSRFRVAQGQEEGNAAEIQIAERREGLTRTMAMVEDRRVVQTFPMAARPIQAATPLPGIAKLCADLELREVAEQSNASAVASASNPSTTTLSEMLDHRICSARKYMLARGEAMVASVVGISEQQLERQCEQIIPFVGGALPTNWRGSSANEVIDTLRASIAASGQAPEALHSTALVCTSIGYKQDLAALVLSSALIGSVAGDADMLETVALLRAMEASDWIESDMTLSWFEAAYAVWEETSGIGEDGRDALNARIEAETER